MTTTKDDFVAATALVDRAPGLAALATPAARAVLTDTLVALSRAAEDHPEIEEIDVNPLILGADGAVAVDALAQKGRNP